MYKISADPAEAATPAVNVNNASAAAHNSTACTTAVSSSAASAAAAVAWKPGCPVDSAPQDLSGSREQNYCKSLCTKSDIILLLFLFYYHYYYYF